MSTALLIMLTPSTTTIMGFLIALIAIAFYTLTERKFLGYFQTRKGPNKPSIIGLPQPFADALKLFNKEQAKPAISNHILFAAAPAISLFLAMFMWFLYPHNYQALYMPLGVLLFLSISRINVYPVFIAGWCSNSKYALLGSLRGIAQTISYEVRIALILLCGLLFLHRLDLTEISISQYSWISLVIIPLGAIWFITCLAETNRTPFDFAEGESELVSGFNTEYRRGLFAIIFIAEYTNILIISLLTSVVFCGSIGFIDDSFIVVKTVFFAILFVWIRATYPRIRYDHLIFLTWKYFLPIIIGLFIILFPFSIILG